MILTKTPKLNKRSNKLDLIALSTNMRQTNNQIILQQTLNNNTSINPRQIKIYCQSVNHIQTLSLNKIFKNILQLCLRYVFYPTMLDEFL